MIATDPVRRGRPLRLVSDASDLRDELRAREAEEREVIDFARERVRRALLCIQGGYSNPIYLDAARNEVGAIGYALDRRARQLTDPEGSAA